MPQACGLQAVINKFDDLNKSEELVLAVYKRYLKKPCFCPAHLVAFGTNKKGELFFETRFVKGQVKQVSPHEILAQDFVTAWNVVDRRFLCTKVEVSFSQIFFAGQDSTHLPKNVRKFLINQEDVAPRVLKNFVF